MNGLSCEDVEKALVALTLNPRELSEAERGAILAQVDGCAGCRELYEDYVRISAGLLHAVPARVPPPALKASLMAQVQQSAAAAPAVRTRQTSRSTPGSGAQPIYRKRKEAELLGLADRQRPRAAHGLWPGSGVDCGCGGRGPYADAKADNVAERADGAIAIGSGVANHTGGPTAATNGRAATNAGTL